jgi:transcriptional regulator NrdR family protein
MRCRQCGHLHTKVLDSRTSKGGKEVMRRRECCACHTRWTTAEVHEAVLLRRTDLPKIPPRQP